MAVARLLAFSGSLRKDSYNTKLVRAAAQAATAAGAEATVIELRDFPMPLFNEDDEKATGLPETAKRFRALLLGHDGLLIASPEYNSSVTAALKNAIDWASRPLPGEASLACFAGKVAGLMATSPGDTGGLRGLVHLRAILGNIQVLVVPEQMSMPRAHEAFNPDGGLKDEKRQKSLENVVRRVVTVAARLKA